MDWLVQIFNWVANNEAVLSGIAAVIAIIAVVFALSYRAFRAWRGRSTKSDSADLGSSDNDTTNLRQEVRYCKLSGGLKIAWTSTGSGYPLVRALGWFTNLDVEWNSPISSPFWVMLGNRFRLIRYDGRGMGLSDRDVGEFSAESRLEDLETVIEASGVEKFALMGLSEGGTTAIAYAAKHPERVSHLIVWGSYLVTPDAEDIPQFGVIARQIPKYWGSDSAAFHQMFTALFLPDGNAEQNKLFNEMQRSSSTPEVAFNFLKSAVELDVRDIARDVQVPALVLHRKGDLVVPARYGQEIASQLPNARMVLLEGNNHWMIASDDDMGYVVRLIENFVL